jgi:hypothetical protein
VTSPADIDDRALELRREGRSFVRIAKELGLDRSGEAIAAFSRSLHRRPAAERQRLLGEELRRLDNLATGVRKNAALDAQEIERRLRVVERMRSTIVTG